MQHEDIAKAMNMSMMDYWNLHSRAEASELEYGRFIPCPVHLTKNEKRRKEQIAAMNEILANI